MIEPAVRRLFPVTRRLAYFDVAANAPLADPVREAVDAYLDGLAAEGSRGFRGWMTVAAACRKRAARLIGADPTEIALLRNTSEGMNLVANGLGLGKGDSIVLVHGDFPANVLPWKRLEAQGVAIRFVRPDAWNRVTPGALLDACDDTTRLVAASFVSFTNGFRLDVRGTGERLRERGILFFLDAIQGLGHLPLDVTRDLVDFLSADAHKWLLAPEGIGVFYVRRALLERLRPVYVSWLSTTDPWDHESYAAPLLPDARRFEYATPNTAGIHALAAALDLVLGIGVEAIAEHDLAIAGGVAEGVLRRGYRLRSPRGAGESSGIVAFDRPGTDPKDLVKRLREAGVVAAPRGGMVRASCHLYNDASDVDRLLEALL